MRETKATGAGRLATEAVAEFASTLAFDDIPADVVERAQLDILDTIGCALFGQTLPIARVVERALWVDVSGPGTAVWGSGRRTDPATASLINGTMVHSFELDDLHHVAILHPGGVTLPAVLALAERDGVTGRDLVTAHVAGIELSSRVGLMVGPSTLKRGWHNFGAIGIFGAAAGASRVLGHSPGQLRDALGIAGSFASGLMAAQYGSMVKRMHGGQAAHNGLKAALLAGAGFTGISHIFDSDYGNYLPTLAEEWQLDELTSELGRRWETLNVGHKRYASCGSTHSALDVVLELRERHGLTAEDVAGVRIVGSTSNLSHVGWPYAPDTVTTAQMNMQYCVAVALLDGACFVEQFDEKRLADPRILALINSITIEADSAIDRRGRGHRHEVHVEIRLHDSRVLSHSAISAQGSAAFPLSRGELTDKFMRLSSHVMPHHACTALLDEVMSLSNERSDVRTLASLLSTEKGPAHEDS